MNKMILTAVIAVMVQGCASTIRPKEPLYGPHTITTMTNREWDIERRNIYSDGWQDAWKAARKYK